MCFTATRQKTSNQADSYRIKMYQEEKRRIPLTLPPREYEEELKRLARKYKI